MDLKNIEIYIYFFFEKIINIQGLEFLIIYKK